jgi:hypothetical protein
MRRLERLEPRSEVSDFPAQLGDFPALVDELDGEAAKRVAKSLGANFGANPRQVRLVVKGHGAVSLWTRGASAGSQLVSRPMHPALG